MAFREDREAVARRADAAERDAADARHQLQAEQLRAVEVDDLRKRLDTLTRERDALARGVEPKWRNRMVAASVILVVAIAGGAFVAWQTSRIAARDRAEIGRLVTQLEAVQPQIDAARAARESALVEAEAAVSHADDQRRALAGTLTTARMQSTGEVFLVTGRVTRVTGDGVPAREGDACAMTVRLSAGACLASVVCEGDRVFPLIEPIPTLLCTGTDDFPWRSGVVGHVVTQVPGYLPLLDYDRRRGTVVVRETAVPWSIELDVRDAMPLFVR